MITQCFWFDDSEQTGKTVVTAKVPDTITTWVASAFAMSDLAGLGVSKPTSLKVFQPFFVSITLPYSVIRGEEVSITATVFNYESKCLTVSVWWYSNIRVNLESSPVAILIKADLEGATFACNCRVQVLLGMLLAPWKQPRTQLLSFDIANTNDCRSILRHFKILQHFTCRLW